MKRDALRTLIRTATELDATDETDSPITATQLNVWIDIEYKNLHRKIARVSPSVYTKVGAQQTLSGSNVTLTLAADFDTMIRIERLYGDSNRWVAIEVSDELNVDRGAVAVREEGAAFLIGPTVVAPGIYRITYIAKPGVISDDVTDYDLPDGAEDILSEMVAARVRQRRDDDGTPHLQRAAAAFEDLRKELRRRYGRHGVPGLRIVKGW